MLNEKIVLQLTERSETKNFPDLMKEWKVVDGGKSIHGFIVTLKNVVNGREVDVLGEENISELSDPGVLSGAQGYMDLYRLLELLDDKFAKNRADQLAERLTGPVIDVLEERSILPATAKNENDPSKDIEFLRQISEKGAREQSIRARLNGLFNYGTPAHKAISEFCQNQTKVCMRKAMAAKVMS